MTLKCNKPIEDVVAAIEALDLDPIKFKLMDPEEGKGWSRETVDRLETEYKRFLTLVVKYPDAVIAPSKDVDAFWHGHILDTMKYAEDCERVFGYFLHHFPYFGMRGAEDAAALAEAGRKMQELSTKEFGSTRNSAAFCYAAKPASAAFCYATRPAIDLNAAFCYAAQPTKLQDTAFCYAAKPVSSAFCYAAGPQAKADAAFCYAAKPDFEFTRPKLPAAA